MHLDASNDGKVRVTLTQLFSALSLVNHADLFELSHHWPRSTFEFSDRLFRL